MVSRWYASVHNWWECQIKSISYIGIRIWCGYNFFSLINIRYLMYRRKNKDVDMFLSFGNSPQIWLSEQSTCSTTLTAAKLAILRDRSELARLKALMMNIKCILLYPWYKTKKSIGNVDRYIVIALNKLIVNWIDLSICWWNTMREHKSNLLHVLENNHEMKSKWLPLATIFFFFCPYGAWGTKLTSPNLRVHFH